jgi:acyl-CoA thioester hydrolase
MSDSSAQHPVAPSRDAFDYFEIITLRYADNDVNGHVNNAHYYAFFDTAVEGFLRATGLRGVLAGEVFTPVVASSCRYFQEISYPGDVTLGVKLARLGRTSLTYEIAIFTPATDPTAAALGSFTTVCTNKASRRPTEIPAAVRFYFQEQSEQRR